MHDVAIIGGGPAALSAAVYSGRALLSTALYEAKYCGGQATITDWIDNYPGFPQGIAGPELAAAMEKQAERYGVEKVLESVVAVTRQDGAAGFALELGGGRTVAARSVIVATGADFRKLGIPGEDEYTGRGVSYCGTCDGAFFQGADIAVVGGGDTAMKEAVYLTRFARSVTVVHRRDTLRAEKIIQRDAFANGKISFVWNSVPEEIVGGPEEKVAGLRIRNVRDGGVSLLTVGGVFIFIGRTPNSGMVGGIAERDGLGYIRVDPGMRTNVPGLFAAGDVRSGPFKQVITACADGATAAFSAEEFLHAQGR